jgi:hypothetical protein
MHQPRQTSMGTGGDRFCERGFGNPLQAKKQKRSENDKALTQSLTLIEYGIQSPLVDPQGAR